MHLSQVKEQTALMALCCVDDILKDYGIDANGYSWDLELQGSRLHPALGGSGKGAPVPSLWPPRGPSGAGTPCYNPKATSGLSYFATLVRTSWPPASCQEGAQEAGLVNNATSAGQVLDRFGNAAVRTVGVATSEGLTHPLASTEPAPRPSITGMS